MRCCSSIRPPPASVTFGKTTEVPQEPAPSLDSGAGVDDVLISVVGHVLVIETGTVDAVQVRVPLSEGVGVYHREFSSVRESLSFCSASGGAVPKKVVVLIIARWRSRRSLSPRRCLLQGGIHRRRRRRRAAN